MENLTLKICNLFNLNPYEVVVPKYGTKPCITRLQFISELLSSKSGAEASQNLGRGVNTFMRYKLKLLPGIGSDKNEKVSWRYYLLSKIGYKTCFTCTSVLELDHFYKDSTNSDNLDNLCKSCSKKEALLNKDYHSSKSKNHYYSNKSDYLSRNSARRAHKGLARPSWQCGKSISNFIDNTPKGYEADHFYPLKGFNVSGLDSLDNLNYILREENRFKYNKMPEDFYSKDFIDQDLKEQISKINEAIKEWN